MRNIIILILALLSLASCEPSISKAKVSVVYFDNTKEDYVASFYTIDQRHVLKELLDNGCTTYLYPSRCNVKSVSVKL